MNLDNSIQIPEAKSPLLERFGLFYLNLFRKQDLKHNVFDISDEELRKRVNKIEAKGIILSSLLVLFVFFPQFG